MSSAFYPQPIYARNGADASTRVMVAPAKYIQGPGVLQNVAGYLAQLGWQRVGILASARGHASQAGEVAERLAQTDVVCVQATFRGECSVEAVTEHSAALGDEQIDGLVALGGGKCVDAGKCVAHRLGVPLVVIPTLASNDAPCSAVSVMYTPAGVAAGAEFFPLNPTMVIVDTQVVAAAPERYLVAGMGDAMATWYEAKVCMENPAARTVVGARPTLTACAMGELCAHTLFEQGVSACAQVAAEDVGEALEAVVEANTLLSGVGFESGGLAAAHGYAQGFTVVPTVEHNYLHGEMVALGVLSQLVMQQQMAEAQRVAEFFVNIGLPVHLGQVDLAPSDSAIDDIVAGTLAFDPLHNLPFKVTAELVKQSLLDAHALGSEVTQQLGDEAYRRIRH